MAVTFLRVIVACSIALSLSTAFTVSNRNRKCVNVRLSAGIPYSYTRYCTGMDTGIIGPRSNNKLYSSPREGEDRTTGEHSIAPEEHSRSYMAGTNESSSSSTTTTILDDTLGSARQKRRTVTATASLDLPVLAQNAFDTFCDFPRQPSWSNWLKSVEYLEDEEKERNVNDDVLLLNLDDDDPFPIPTSRWTARIFGLQYSWSSVVTEYNVGKSMGWRSISGMRSSGRVTFEPLKEEGEEEVIPSEMEKCRMTLTMSVQAPRAIASIFRRSDKLEGFFRERVLGGTLMKFSNVLQQEDILG